MDIIIGIANQDEAIFSPLINLLNIPYDISIVIEGIIKLFSYDISSIESSVKIFENFVEDKTKHLKNKNSESNQLEFLSKIPNGILSIFYGLFTSNEDLIADGLKKVVVFIKDGKLDNNNYIWAKIFDPFIIEILENLKNKTLKQLINNNKDKIQKFIIDILTYGRKKLTD